MTDTTTVETDEFDENAVSEYTTESSAAVDAPSARPSATAPGASSGATKLRCDIRWSQNRTCSSTGSDSSPARRTTSTATAGS